MAPQGKILIVEDDEIARKNLSRLLNQDGHKIITASTGSAAINLVGKHLFDLVITDLVLGDLNGIEVLTEVKKRFKDIEVIVITGYASIATAIEATKKRTYLLKHRCPIPAWAFQSISFPPFLTHSFPAKPPGKKAQDWGYLSPSVSSASMVVT